MKPKEEQIRDLVTEAVKKVLYPKPEHMTCLRGDTMVYKDHPRIAFRGACDSLEADLILFQLETENLGLHRLTEDLTEIITFIRWLIRCEVSGEALGEFRLLGLTPYELREHSYHPRQYYGIPHFLPDYGKGPVVARLNYLRTRAREAELVAYKAFKKEDGSVEREDILMAFNRLSSLFWILCFWFLTGHYDENKEACIHEHPGTC